jgi:hypothetical protein
MRVSKHVKPCTKIEPLKPCKDYPKPPVPEFPALSIQMIAWKDAVLRWRKAGKPKRTDAEVEEILVLCKGCSWYDAKKQRCLGCGCKVTESGVAVFNKARMKTETCPRSFW